MYPPFRLEDLISMYNMNKMDLCGGTVTMCSDVSVQFQRKKEKPKITPTPLYREKPTPSPAGFGYTPELMSCGILYL